MPDPTEPSHSEAADPEPSELTTAESATAETAPSQTAPSQTALHGDGVQSAAVAVERVGNVSVITLDDGKANALSKETVASLAAAIATAERDSEVGAVVIVGWPGVLSGGFDLSVMRSGDPTAVADLVADGGALVRQCYASSLPVVAACTGHAVAAGALLLLGCDRRIGAAGDFKVGLPEVVMKMALPAWAVTIAADRLSRQHVQHALTHGLMYSAAAAVDAGFLDETATPDGVVERAIAAATELAATVHRPSYASIASRLRGDVLSRMADQIAADRPV